MINYLLILTNQNFRVVCYGSSLVSGNIVFFFFFNIVPDFEQSYLCLKTEYLLDSTVMPQTIMTSPLGAASTFPYVSLTQPIPTAFPPTVAPLPQRPVFYPPILYWYPSPPVSPPAPQTPAISYYTTATTTTNAASGPYTGPCMIIMRGLPINVTIQDIINYFQGFPGVSFMIKASQKDVNFFIC